ncbi:MAG: intradiol ring-cleavage dioxygenase [Burkholderiales bacterium]|nr:intradiol ring-cleavage dioxygenase [Burkholderiales bacterium]
MPSHPRQLTFDPAADRRLATAALVFAPALLLGMPTARAQGRRMLTPSQTEGPFYPLQLPADRDHDLLAHGAARYARGTPVWLEGEVTDVEGRPVRGADVEIWQCDADGHYHHSGDGGRADPDFQGFGRVRVGADGRYRFRTIEPVPYTGRTPHIHLKVKLGSRELLTTQVYVEGHPGNARDFLWRRLSDAERAAVTVPFTAGGDGRIAHLPVVVAA